MKISAIFVLITGIGLIQAKAEQPVEILCRSQYIYPQEWYNAQSYAWNSEIKHDQNDRKAWLNYFLASYYAGKPEDEINKIISGMEANIPGSFEVSFAKGIGGEYSPSAFENFKEAYKTEPANYLTYGPLMICDVLYDDKQAGHEMALKILKSGYFPEGLLQYNYNVLMSVGENGILFTKGENTTLPAWIIQDIMNVRPEVKIINIDLLKNKNYFRTQLKGLITGQTDKDLQSGEVEVPELMASLPDLNPDQHFYYALTIPKEILKNNGQDLYIVGLATQASPQRIDNIATIKQNIENNFLLDYLTVDFNGETQYSTGKIFNTNYLAPMLILDDHYKKNGDMDKAGSLEKIINKIAEETGQQDAVKNYIARNVTPQKEVFIPYDIDVKDIDKNMKPIKGNLYASEHETTYKEYETFLNFLRSNNKAEELKSCDFDLSSYDEVTRLVFEAFQTIPDKKVAQKVHDDFSNYPAVNISYQAADDYCQWLTDQYNNDPKREFHKVKFRLPSVNEWQVSALGYKKFSSWNLKENKIECAHLTVSKKMPPTLVDLGNEEFRYPWGVGAYEMRNSPVNQFDCYLGNFKTPAECKCPGNTHGDGFRMMAPVNCYFANDFGLYDVVGNVAEMTKVRGKACGGSWMQTPEESTIESVADYKGPNAWTGFRVFMEVVEP